MQVSVDELKKDALKYISLLNTENTISITHKGERVANLSRIPRSTVRIDSMSQEEKMEILKLFNINPNALNHKTVCGEKL